MAPLNWKQNDTKHLFTSKNSGWEERDKRISDFASTLLKIIATCSWDLGTSYFSLAEWVGQRVGSTCDALTIKASTSVWRSPLRMASQSCPVWMPWGWAFGAPEQLVTGSGLPLAGGATLGEVALWFHFLQRASAESCWPHSTLLCSPLWMVLELSSRQWAICSMCCKGVASWSHTPLYMLPAFSNLTFVSLLFSPGSVPSH